MQGFEPLDSEDGIRWKLLLAREFPSGLRPLQKPLEAQQRHVSACRCCKDFIRLRIAHIELSGGGLIGLTVTMGCNDL